MTDVDLTSNEFEQFRGLYGDDLFQFALNREPETLDLEGLDEDEREIVGSLYLLIKELEKHNEGPHGLELSLTSLALTTEAAKDPMLSLCLRRRSEKLSDGESFEQELDNAALRTYPYLLLSARMAGRSGGFPFGMGPMFMRWEDQQALAGSISAHGAVSKLFDVDQPEASKVVGRQSFVALSTGSASTLQETMLPSLVLNTAFLWMTLNGQHSFADFRSAVDEVIRTLDSAGATGKAKVQVCMVHRGVNIQQSGTVKLDGVRLLPWSIRLGAIVPSEAQPSIDADGNFNGFITITDVEVEVKVDAFSPDSRIAVADSSALHSRLDEISRDLALTAFLTFEENRAGAQESFRTVVTPFMLSSASFSRDVSPVTPTLLTDELLPDFKNWHSRVSALHITRTEVGLRRVVSAIVHRRDAVDSVIDAVVSWENLFGDKEGELRFRISTAMSLLLTDDYEERKELQKEIRSLYDKRSRIVHGGTPPTGKEAEELRDRVLEITRNLLRVVYEHYPEVLRKQTTPQELILRIASDSGASKK
jgi:hypothetical protein